MINSKFLILFVGPLVLHVRRCSKFTWSASVEIHVRSLVRKYEQLMEQLADPEVSVL